MAAPLVSVVVPAYNAQRTLRATIASIAAQTVDDLEIVVVDDGSTDATVGVAEATSAPGLRVISQANAGHAAARNTGIENARGRYVAFLDADDVWLPTKLARQLEVLDRAPHIRALQTGAARVDNALTALWTEPCQPSSDDVLWDTICFRNMPALMSTLIAERSLLEEVGRFDASLVILQDWDLAIRLARRGQLQSLPDVLSAYRFHATSQSANVEIHIEPGLRVLEKLFSDPELPAPIRGRRREAYARFYTMLCGGAVKVNRLAYATYWGVRALLNDPTVAGYILKFPVRRVRRRRGNDATLTLPLPAAVLDANAAGSAQLGTG